MPLLLILMVVLIIRSVTLEGASKGLSFYLKPDFSKVTGGVVLAAIGQAFFSLSLGMGAMITYGSYVSRDRDIVTSSSLIAILDTALVLMALKKREWLFLHLFVLVGTWAWWMMWSMSMETYLGW